MKRLNASGVLLFDRLDIALISFSIGSTTSYLLKKHKKYKKRKNLDPIIIELKQKSPIIVISVDNKPLKLPLVRGGERLNMLSLAIKSKRLALLIEAIKRREKQLKFLQVLFFIINRSLTSKFGLRFAMGGSLDYTQFLLIAFPMTVAGFLLEQVIANPLASIFIPLAILSGRAIEDVPNPYQKCKLLCKAEENFHNKEVIKIEMKELNLFVTSPPIQLPLDKISLVCVEEKLSILQRFKLRKLVESERAQKSVQYFNEFIKKFPECDSDPEAVYEQLIKKVTE